MAACGVELLLPMHTTPCTVSCLVLYSTPSYVWDLAELFLVAAETGCGRTTVPEPVPVDGLGSFTNTNDTETNMMQHQSQHGLAASNSSVTKALHFAIEGAAKHAVAQKKGAASRTCAKDV